MAVMSTPVVTNDLTRTFIQDEGIGTVFNLYDCQSLPNWTRPKTAAVRVKVKSPHEYGKHDVKATARGTWEGVTFPVNAWTPDELDWLLDVDCPVDFQLVMGRCGAPSDLSQYTKIRHFYRSEPTSQGETEADYLGEEEAAGIQTQTAWTAEDMVTIVQVDTERQRNGVTETQAFNDIAFLAEGRCEGNCGARVEDGQWGVAVADANYGTGTANVWYTRDKGATWELCAIDPFSTMVDANLSSCVILPGEVAPRIIVFRGNEDPAYGARCSISDDWGASAWTEVAMGGTANISYVNGAFKFAVGLIYAVGNGGYIYYSEDRGDSWTEIDSDTTGTTEDLWDIHLPPDKSSVIYAVGSSNTVITSDDSGASWGDITTAPADGTEDLYAVDVDSKYRVYVGGEVDASGECLWVTDDGGVNWTALTFTGSTLADGEVRRFRQCRRAPRQHKVFIHGVDGTDADPDTDKRYGDGENFRMFRTLDGGGSFERLDLVTNNGLNGLAIVDINHAWACGEVVDTYGEIQRYTPS